jgi:hypothetical protein
MFMRLVLGGKGTLQASIRRYVSRMSVSLDLLGIDDMEVTAFLSLTLSLT